MKTTIPPDGAAPVEPYFSGIAEQDFAVSIIWRAYVPEEGKLLWPRATDREAIDVPLSEAREALGEDKELWRLGIDGVTIETTSPERLRPGNTVVHGPLMEDLATGRMSAAQIAQRIIHAAADTETGAIHDFALVKQLFLDEVDDILRLLKEEVEEGNETHQRLYDAADVRYRKAGKIGMRWVKNYTDFDFRSMGSYSRADLEEIAAAEDAF